MLRCFARLLFTFILLTIGGFYGGWSNLANGEENNPLARFGFASTADDVARCLARFSPDDAASAEIRRLFAELGDDKFLVRQRAHAALLGYPLLPADLLRESQASDDPEVRDRATRIARARGDDHAEKVFRAALTTIRDHRLAGLADEVVAVFNVVGGADLERLAREALAATVTHADIPVIRTALRSDNPVLRAAAVPAIAAIADHNALIDIKPLLADPHDRVKLAAALTVADFGDAACLMPLVELLRSDNMLVRLKAVKALRYLTQQEFGYRPITGPEDQARAIAAWADWVRAAGSTPRLRYPLDITDEMVLLADAGLTGWQVIVNGQVAARPTWKSHLTVENGILKCGPGFYGYLRPDRELTNYRLTLGWRWPTAAFNDAGVLLMLSGPDGRDGNGLEVQLHQGNAGDFYRIGGFRGGQMRTGVRSRLAESSERPQGEWNQMVAEVRDGKVTVTINDVVQNKATDCPQTPTRVGLRIERYPIEFRNLLLMPLE
jgi:hypothetical protein